MKHVNFIKVDTPDLKTWGGFSFLPPPFRAIEAKGKKPHRFPSVKKIVFQDRILSNQKIVFSQLLSQRELLLINSYQAQS